MSLWLQIRQIAFKEGMERKWGDPPPPTLASVERTTIFQAMLHHSGSVSKVSRNLGISRSSLYRKLRSYVKP